MKIILVHGAWHGAWCWERVETHLKEKAQVYFLNMPGRSFENTPQYKKISLQDYVKSIEDCVLSSQEPVILVGHSLAGLTSSQVTENHPDKIRALIYVASFIPANGECLFDITKTFKTPGISTELVPDPVLNKMGINLSEKTRWSFFNTCEEIWAERAMSQLSPEPLRAFNTRIRLTDERFGKVKKIYIKCLRDNALEPAKQDEMVLKANISRVHELDCDHSPFYSMPKELSELILGL